MMASEKEGREEGRENDEDGDAKDVVHGLHEGLLLSEGHDERLGLQCGVAGAGSHGSHGEVLEAIQRPPEDLRMLVDLLPVQGRVVDGPAGQDGPEDRDTEASPTCRITLMSPEAWAILKFGISEMAMVVKGDIRRPMATPRM